MTFPFSGRIRVSLLADEVHLPPTHSDDWDGHLMGPGKNNTFMTIGALWGNLNSSVSTKHTAVRHSVKRNHGDTLSHRVIIDEVKIVLGHSNCQKVLSLQMSIARVVKTEDF